MSTNPQEFISNSTSDVETKKIGACIAKKIAILFEQGKSLDSKGWTIVLNGTLGSGKTQFAQGFLAALGVEQEVVSPTFVLVIPYETRDLRVAHLDLYRIEHAEEVDDLGLDELVEDGCVLLIEWGEKFSFAIPPADLKVNLNIIGNQNREIRIVASSPKGESLVEQLRLKNF